MSDTFIGFLLGSFTTALVLLIVYYILLVIANWRIFTKAGEAGWKSIIPFLNSYVVYKICWKPVVFWVTLALAVLEGIFYSLAKNSVVALVLMYIVTIIAAIITIVQNVKLSKAFGHGIGFAIGLIILNPIFVLILAFGSSTYVGNDSN